MNNNSFNGSIPAELGRLPNLLHLLLDNNDMEGPLPEDIANISTITIVQLDNNPKIASTIPQQWVQMPSLIKLAWCTDQPFICGFELEQTQRWFTIKLILNFGNSVCDLPSFFRMFPTSLFQSLMLRSQQGDMIFQF
jgi:hypothetical protein